MAQLIQLPDNASHNVLQTLSLLWEYSLVGLAIVAEDGRWLRVNPVYCAMLEYTEAELTSGMTYQEVTHPADLAADVTMAQQTAASEGRTGYDMRKRYITKRNNVVWTLLRVEAVRAESGAFLWYIVQCQELADVLSHSPAAELHRKQPNLARWLSANWSWFVPVLTLLGLTIGAVIRALLGLETP